MGTGELRAARSVHHHAAAPGRRDRDHLEVDASSTGHYGVSPFQNYELAAPGTHAVLKSYDTLGGPTTNGVVFMAKKFRDANPKVTSAVYAAFEEVSEFIKKEPRQSAEVYIRMTNEKRSGPDEMAKMISDPDNVWATTPLNAMRYVEFMNKVGTVKKVPADWRDLFMPEVARAGGELMAHYRLYCTARSGNSYKVALYLNCAGLDWEPVGVEIRRRRERATRTGAPPTTRWAKSRCWKPRANGCRSPARSYCGLPKPPASSRSIADRPVRGAALAVLR